MGTAMWTPPKTTHPGLFGSSDEDKPLWNDTDN